MVCFQYFRCVLSQVLPVPVHQAARAKYFHAILVETFTANNHSSLIPFEWLIAVLVLYGDVVANMEWWELLGVLTELLMAAFVSAGHR